MVSVVVVGEAHVMYVKKNITNFIYFFYFVIPSPWHPKEARMVMRNHHLALVLKKKHRLITKTDPLPKLLQVL